MKKKQYKNEKLVLKRTTLTPTKFLPNEAGVGGMNSDNSLVAFYQRLE